MTDDRDASGAAGPPGAAEDALLDQTLRQLLTRVPDSAEPANLPDGALAAIDRAVTHGWPEGTPPTAEQIAREDADDDPNTSAPTDGDHQHQTWHTGLHGHGDAFGHATHDDHLGHGGHHPSDGHSDGGHHYDGGHF